MSPLSSPPDAGREPGNPGASRWTPVFETAGRAEPGQRRLLLLSHAFAPSRVVGALRWVRAIQQLASSGYGFDVVSTALAPAAATERGLLDALPSGTRLFAVAQPTAGPWQRTFEGLASVVRFRNRMRANATPARPTGAPTGAASADNSAHRGSPSQALLRALHFLAQDEIEERWARRVIADVAQHLDPASYAALVTSGPPHAVHLHADRLARRLARPHVADLRDPWTHWSWVDGSKVSPLFLKRTRPRQAEVMRHASLVLTTSDRQSGTLRTAYPDAAGRVHTIFNGTDEEPLPPATDDGVFRIAFTGVLYVDRSPAAFFRGVRRFVDTVGASPTKVRVEFMGDVETIGGKRVRDIAAEAGIDPWLTLTPAGPRAAAMALLARSHVLLSFGERLRETIPAKIFEYARFPAWLLLIGPEDSAAHDLLRGGGALIAAADDVPAIQSLLEGAYQAWQAKGRPGAIADVLPLDRRRQVEHLAQLLDSVIG